MTGVSVILPTYNERGTVLEVVEGVLEEMNDWECEVIVVDDSSPDGTDSLVRTTYRDDDRVIVIVRSGERGLSSAVLRGLDVATHRYCLVMDADGQHPPDRAPVLVSRLMADRDAVVGSRHVSGGSIQGWSWSRRVASDVASTVAQLTVPAARSLTDPMSGYFAVDREVFDERVRDACDPHGYKILLELLTHAERIHDDVDVAEVSITFRDRQAGESKLTLDEVVRFGEHCGSCWFAAHGLSESVYPPLLLRSLELGAVVGVGLVLLYVGLIVGDVDGAVGAALIATAGAAISFAVLRWHRTSKRWQDTDEPYAQS